jgi:PAS domain S-box-containing protein
MYDIQAEDRAEEEHAEQLRRDEAEGRISTVQCRAVAVALDAGTAEEAARESDERLRLLSDNLPDSALYQFTRDPDGAPRLLYVSAGIERLTGVRSDDALRDASLVLGRILPEHQARLAAAEAKSARELSDFDLEVPIRRVDGELRWMRIKSRPRRAPDGRVTWDGVQTDVTERKRIEEQLRLTNARFEAALQASSVMVFNQDRDLRYTWSHNSARGEDAYEILGKRDADLYPRDTDVARIEAIKRAVLETGVGQRHELCLLHEGVPRYYDTTVQPQRDADGVIVGVTGAAVDMTERRRVEEALKDVSQRKDAFLAMLAHELRNPLAPIRNAAQLLRLQGPNDPALERAHRTIDRQLNHLVRLVDDLLDVSRVSRGRITLRTGPLDLNEVVRETVEMSRALLDTRDHVLTVTVPPEPVYVEGDLTRLTQVANNLLDNAMKFTSKGGRIDLMVERQGTGEGAEAVLRVSDSGIGLDPATRNSVFDLFYQVERDLDRSEGGIGVGLALVKSLVELHGGRVEAHSQGPGQGSEFVVRLPALPEAPPAPLPEPPPAPMKASLRLRVLVVDDNVDAAETMAMLLDLDGHETLVAHDGREAVAIALAERPDVVLLDIGLPGLNGYEACKAMREAGLTDTLIIATTGYGQDDDRRQSREAGFDSHQLKPLSLPKIQELVHRHVTARKTS